MHNKEFVTIAYFSNSAEAGLARELLENQGIQATLGGGNFGGLEPLPLPGGYSEIRLLVPAGEAERARELYDAFFNAASPPSEEFSDDPSKQEAANDE
jgi:hypothetical protein